MAVNLSNQMLRSFVAIVDAGTMLNAADQVFLSQSALSLQIKRLEEIVQQTLFLRDGRRLVLTNSGETLLEYARRMLALNDQAVEALSEGRASGPIRVGTVQDFADTLLTGVLARFAERHPESQIFARVASTVELEGMLGRDQLDLVLGYAAAEDPRALKLVSTQWYGDAALLDHDVLPLAMLQRPCRFREAAIASLERLGRPWRTAIETPNLSTLRAGVEAGLGVTCRTAFFLPEAHAIGGLPSLPQVACMIACAPDLSRAKARLAALATDAIRNL